MLQVLLIAMVIFIFSKLMNIREYTEIDKIIKETQKYSGIHPVLYKTFLANMSLATDYMNNDKFKNSQTLIINQSGTNY